MIQFQLQVCLGRSLTDHPDPRHPAFYEWRMDDPQIGCRSAIGVLPHEPFSVELKMLQGPIEPKKYIFMITVDGLNVETGRPFDLQRHLRSARSVQFLPGLAVNASYWNVAGGSKRLAFNGAADAADLPEGCPTISPGYINAAVFDQVPPRTGSLPAYEQVAALSLQYLPYALLVETLQARGISAHTQSPDGFNGYPREGSYGSTNPGYMAMIAELRKDFDTDYPRFDVPR